MDVSGDPRSGVFCLVKAEVQGEGVLITVRTSTGTERNRQDHEHSFVDPDEAVAAVSTFLHSFADAIEPPDRKPQGGVG